MKKFVATLLSLVLAAGTMSIAASASSIFDAGFGGRYTSYPLIYGQLHEIEAVAGEGGTISPAGVSEVIFDKDLTYTITPDEGYEIEAILVDGEAVEIADTYTFEDVKTAHTISVTFKEAEAAVVLPVIMEDATREAVIIALWTMDGTPVPADAAAEATDSEIAVAWAVEKGIVTGYEDESLRLDQIITLEEAVMMLYRYGRSIEVIGEEIVSSLPQVVCSVWAETAVLWAELLEIPTVMEAADLTVAATTVQINTALEKFVFELLIAE